MKPIPIVMYHSVNNQPSRHPLGHLSLSSTEFEYQLRAIRNSGFTFVTMSELWELASTGRMATDNIIALTFDDGYLDNYLIAQPLMRRYGAKGTVYVNPDFIGAGKRRTIEEVPDAWGYLNWEELRIMEELGDFDVQSHTMTHNRIFSSDRIVDVYTPKKFHRYYWLTYLIAPETKQRWEGDPWRFASTIPEGYPIFEHTRALGGRGFWPAEEFVERCVSAFRTGGYDDAMNLNQVPAEEKGRLEEEDEFLARVDEELVASKKTIEGNLKKTVEFVSFPAGVYSDRVVERAGRIGYRAYFLSSRDPRKGNATALAEVSQGRGTRPVPLRRIAFTKNYPKPFLRGPAAYWVATLKIGAFRGDTLTGMVLKGCRAVVNFVRPGRV